MSDDDYMTPALREALDELEVQERMKGAPGSGEKLKEYWTEGEGAAKIRWGTPGDFDRCVRHLRKYVSDPEGYCSDMHERATGFRPGHAPSEQRSDTSMVDTPSAARPPVEIRSATAGTEIAEVNVRKRIITMVAVPYEEPAEVMVRGEIWQEIFCRTAFNGIEKRPQRVRVNREHQIGDTVGKAITFHPSRTEGLLSEVKIANTTRGDDTLALADDDCLSPSVGYIARPSQVTLDRRNMIRRVNTAWLDHIALVEHPAYSGAAIVDVRQAFGPDAHGGGPIHTPILDDFLSDPIVRRALGLE